MLFIRSFSEKKNKNMKVSSRFVRDYEIDYKLYRKGIPIEKKGLILRNNL